MENHLEQWAEEQRSVLCDEASRLEYVACQLARDTPTELDQATLSRREHELLVMHREVAEVLAKLAKAAGECRIVARIVGHGPSTEALTAEELAAAEGRG